MSKEESKSDVVGEARAFISIVGNCGLYPDKAQRWISALCNEVEELRRRNATQEESITHLQSQLRVMKEAIEAALLHLQDCGYKTNKQVQEQLIASITPKGSEQ